MKEHPVTKGLATNGPILPEQSGFPVRLQLRTFVYLNPGGAAPPSSVVFEFTPDPRVGVFYSTKSRPARDHWAGYHAEVKAVQRGALSFAVRPKGDRRVVPCLLRTLVTKND